MRAQTFILIALIFTGVVTMYNEFGLVGGNTYNPNYQVDQSSVNGVTQIDSSQGGGDKSWFEENIPGASAFMWMAKVVTFLGTCFANLLTFGSLIPEYVPGDVGVAFGLIVSGAMWFIVAWTGLQIYMKISTKYMD